MHIVKIELDNVKSLRHFVWELGASDAHAGWHVFLGDNGSGKSTLMRTVSVALLDAFMISLGAFYDVVKNGDKPIKVVVEARLNNQVDELRDNNGVVQPRFVRSLFSDANISRAEGRPATEATKGCFSAAFGPQKERHHPSVWAEIKRMAQTGEAHQDIFAAAPELWDV